MRSFLFVSILVASAGLAQAWTKCMLDCMGNATVTAGCGQDYNATSCMCQNAQFVTLTRTCFYTACVSDIYPWYNLREAECGTLSADLSAPEFIPSNGNSTYDRQQAANNGSASASGTASRSMAPSGSASSAGSSNVATSAAAATSAPATSSRAAGERVYGNSVHGVAVIACVLTTVAGGALLL